MVQQSKCKITVPSHASQRADLLILELITRNHGVWEGPVREVTRSQLKKLMEQGDVRVNDRPISPGSKLRSGEQIVVLFPAPEPTELIPENRDLEILFEDEHLLVLNKPPGLTVHPSSTQKEGTLVHALLFHIKDLSGIGGVLRPGIVHRLDKDTSGALVITKTDEAHVRLAQTFAKHEIDRVYWALCYGSPNKSTQKIESLIGRDPSHRKKMSMTVKTGRKAVTYLKTRENYGLPGKSPFAAWLELKLETGRTHQIRVHLNGIGHSVIGDPLYGKPSSKHTKLLAFPEEVRQEVSHLTGQMLHARVLGFIHPITAKKLYFEANPPLSFDHFHRLLRQYAGS